MTEKQLWEKYEELLKITTEELRKHLTRILETGRLDLPAYNDDYRLPKMLMSIGLERMAEQWQPPTFEAHMELERLRRIR